MFDEDERDGCEEGGIEVEHRVVEHTHADDRGNHHAEEEPLAVHTVEHELHGACAIGEVGDTAEGTRDAEQFNDGVMEHTGHGTACPGMEEFVVGDRVESATEDGVTAEDLETAPPEVESPGVGEPDIEEEGERLDDLRAEYDEDNAAGEQTDAEEQAEEPAVRTEETDGDETAEEDDRADEDGGATHGEEDGGIGGDDEEKLNPAVFPRTRKVEERGKQNGDDGAVVVVDAPAEVDAPLHDDTAHEHVTGDVHIDKL